MKESGLLPEVPHGACLPTSPEEAQNTARRGAMTVQASIPRERHLMAVRPWVAKSDSFRLGWGAEVNPPDCPLPP